MFIVMQVLNCDDFVCFSLVKQAKVENRMGLQLGHMRTLKMFIKCIVFAMDKSVLTNLLSLYTLYSLMDLDKKKKKKK